MDNLVRLAKLFDNFIGCGDSFVRVEDIRAIRKIETEDVTDPDGGEIIVSGYKGIEIITPHGKYVDTSTTFEDFKKMIEVIRQTVKEMTPKVQEVKPLQQVQRKVVPLKDAIPATKASQRMDNVSISITGGAGGASGQLPGADKEPEAAKLVDRHTIMIASPGGIELGRGNPDGNGTIGGSNVSGIIHTSGKYQLVFKDYNDKEAFVSYSVQG